MAETTTCVPRLKTKYYDGVKPRLLAELKHQNVHQVGGLKEIVVNMSASATAHDHKFIESAVRNLATITGQRPVIDKTCKSIIQFKLREGSPIGAHVALRGDRMWELPDRLPATALPRIRDFRGLFAKQFDGRGNYTFGLTGQSVFREIDQDTIDHVRGMDITVVTMATADNEGRALLKYFGLPLKED